VFAEGLQQVAGVTLFVWPLVGHLLHQLGVEKRSVRYDMTGTRKPPVPRRVGVADGQSGGASTISPCRMMWRGVRMAGMPAV
jgi:hypothetical protein